MAISISGRCNKNKQNWILVVEWPFKCITGFSSDIFKDWKWFLAFFVDWVIYSLTLFFPKAETAKYFLFCLQQITRPSQEEKSDEKNEEEKTEKSEKKEDEEKKDEEEKDDKEDPRWGSGYVLVLGSL